MILPNQLTVMRIILTPIFLVLFVQDDPVLKQISVGIFIIAALTDWYDGWLARKINYITNWGKFLDPLADKILTLTAFFAFAYLGILEYWMVILIAVRDISITLIRLYADFKSVSFKTSRSAKWKTFLQMAFLYYLLTFYTLGTFEQIQISWNNILSILMDEKVISYSMLFVTLFTVYTGIMYFLQNGKLIRELFSFENKSN